MIIAQFSIKLLHIFHHDTQPIPSIITYLLSILRKPKASVRWSGWSHSARFLFWKWRRRCHLWRRGSSGIAAVIIWRQRFWRTTWQPGSLSFKAWCSCSSLTQGPLYPLNILTELVKRHILVDWANQLMFVFFLGLLFPFFFLFHFFNLPQVCLQLSFLSALLASLLRVVFYVRVAVTLQNHDTITLASSSLTQVEAAWQSG